QFCLRTKPTLVPYTTLFRSLSSARNHTKMRRKMHPEKCKPVFLIRAKSPDCKAPCAFRTGTSAQTEPAAMSQSRPWERACWRSRSEEHTSELQSRGHLVCRL